jgi:hypothetical protein
MLKSDQSLSSPNPSPFLFISPLLPAQAFMDARLENYLRVLSVALIGSQSYMGIDTHAPGG